ncbi:hypothetical protein B0H16DRAFT_1728592 [Mycena metata]|uniref:YCII-related domain-containing protein n=1 Tax=Mycena metata TaxID=1033252 RepID=A0AAD7N1B9_9AGAR|nr:hypothetical protein B0H16DRAFT_1728592 [Mycena metata]
MARTFAFFGPYVTTPEAQPLRNRIRSTHLARFNSLKESGLFIKGGPFYNDEGAGEGAPDRAIGGSFFIMEAETYAEALKIIQADVYYTEGLWDIPQIRLVEYAAPK